MNKAIIFDWSGTLRNNCDCFYNVCNIMFKELGKEPISKEEIKMNFTLPYMKFWNKYFPDLTKEKQCSMFEKYIHQVGESEMYPNVKEILTSLYKKRWQMFVLSSDNLSKLIPEIHDSGLEHMFTKIIGEVHEKAGFITSLKSEFNLSQDSTFYIGDTSGDIEAGKEAGVKTIGISWGFQHKSILAKSNPDFLIDNSTEIEKILRH